MRYFTGTTAECLEGILREGYLLTEPPKRVWENYSEEYIYLIPFDEKDEEQMQEALHFAAEQASFAVYEFDHTKRVVLEIEGIDDALLQVDPDGKGIGAVRYPFDISITHIRAIHAEKTIRTKEIWELIAITKYFRLKDEKKIKHIDFECLYFDEDEGKEQLFQAIGVKYLDLVAENLLLDENELMNRHYDLLDEVEHCADFEEEKISQLA